VVEPSGFVRSSERRSLTVSVENSAAFPLANRKSITLKLSSYNYPIDDIVYAWANSPPSVLPVEVSTELLDSVTQRLTFEEAEASDCVGNYTAGAYSCVSVRISFKGCTTGGLLKIFLPTVLLILVSWLHFWIHGSWSVPRTISAALPFFIFIALLFLLPITSSALLVWLVFGTLITFASLIEYFLVICCGVERRLRYTNGILHTTTATVHPPPVVQHQYHVEGQHQPTTVLVQPTSDYQAERDVKQQRVGNVASLQLNNNIDYVARIVFPLVFALFIVVYLLVYLL